MLFSILLLSGCQKKYESTQFIHTFMQAWQQKDKQSLQAFGVDSSDLLLWDLQAKDYIEGVDRTLQQQAYDKLNQFSYEILEKTMSFEVLEVKVLMTFYKFDGVIEKSILNTKQLMEHKEVGIYEMLVNVYEAILRHNEKETESVTITFRKINTGWKIQSYQALYELFLNRYEKVLQEIQNI